MGSTPTPGIPGKGYAEEKSKRSGIRRLALIFAVGILAIASDAPAGGISDETCPTTRGEYTNTCPPGTVGTPYSIRFIEREGAGCGPGRQTFHLDSGLLPQGLTLKADGTLSGTASRPGSFQFYVEMREPADDPANCAGKRTQKQFVLRIRKRPWIVSRPSAPPRSEVGVPFRMTLRARGGSGIFAWTLAGGNLPRGLRLSDAGAISGAPLRPGTYRFEAKARDTEARSLRWATAIVVAPTLEIRTRQLPEARAGHLYTAELTAEGGVRPIVWKLTHGRLPRGVRLAAPGRLLGTPAEPGRHLVTIEASDDLGVVRARTVSVVVRQPLTRLRVP